MILDIEDFNDIDVNLDDLDTNSDKDENFKTIKWNESVIKTNLNNYFSQQQSRSLLTSPIHKRGGSEVNAYRKSYTTPKQNNKLDLRLNL